MTNKNLVLALSVVAICIVAGIGIFILDSQKNNQNSNSSSSSTTANNTAEQKDSSKTFSETELVKNNGLSGNKCYAAVDGTVYDLSNFSLWRNGVHSPSGGQASCGKELSNVITKSPHGKSKLKVVPVVGTYSN